MATNKKKIYDVIKKARHPAETPLTILSALFTIAVYGLVTYVLIFGANDNEKLSKILGFFGIQARGINILINVGGPAIFLILSFLFFKLFIKCASEIGRLSIKYPRLQDSNFDKVKEIYDKMTSDLQLSTPPIVYIAGEEKSKNKDKDKNKNTILGIRLNSNKSFSIESKIIEDAIENDDYTNVEYEFARNLGDIYLSHYNIPVIMFTFVFRIVPYLHELVERTLYYSTDKFVSQIIGKEQLMYDLYNNNYDDDLYPHENKEKNIINIIKNVNEYEKIGRVYENFNSEEPIIVYRLEAIYYDKPGKII